MAALTAMLGACSSDEGSGDPEAFCAEATEAAQLEELFADLDPTDVDAALATFTEARETEAELRSLAPEAVRSDVDILVDFLDDLIEGLETEVVSDGERPSVYDDLQPRFDQIEAASATLERYVETNCVTEPG